MKCINLFAYCIISILVSSCATTVGELAEKNPAYKLITDFSKRIAPETGLVLCAYGINHGLPKGYQYKNGVASFSASFYLHKTKNDLITIEEARKLIIFLANSLLEEINSNMKVRPYLDNYPLEKDSIELYLHFEDENRIDLGQGIAVIYFSKGRIRYQGYKIREYTNHYPAKGAHFTILEETYADALEIVSKQGSLVHL